jgi:5-methylcytosine-specific restriction protein A
MQMAAKGAAQRAGDRRHDAKRSSRNYRAWYRTAAWRRIRAEHLALEPVCRMCRANGILNDGGRKVDGSPETNPNMRGLIVDHEQPHRGDPQLFFHGPKQTLCITHHNRVKQRIEAAALARTRRPA